MRALLRTHKGERPEPRHTPLRAGHPHSPAPEGSVCTRVLGLSVLKQLEDPGAEETPGRSDLKSWVCLRPWLVLDATEEGA